MVARDFVILTVPLKDIAVTVYTYVFPKKTAVAELTWEKVGRCMKEMNA